MKKGKKIVKGIISYILALALTVFFALYMNATVGWFMFVALILAPVLSVFFALLTSLFTGVDIEMEDCVLAKGDSCRMKIHVRNKSLFPTTPLEIEMLSMDGVKCQDKQVIASLLPFDKQSFEVTFTAKISGPAMVGIKSVKATDYLGILSFMVRRIAYDKLKRHVAVIPNMADISLRDDKILMIMQAANQYEDSDDTKEAGTNTVGGFPGCDNREYQPGDPLKRINWKQSAKRGKLLVRLDDVLSSKSVNLVLDSSFLRESVNMDKVSDSLLYKDVPKEDLILKIAEDAVEAALGISRALVLSGYTVKFFINGETEFNQYELEDERDLENIRLLLAKYKFDYDGQKERFPEEDILDKYATFLFCTPNGYKDVYVGLNDGEDASRMSVFSIIGDLSGETGEKKAIPERKERIKENNENPKIKEMVRDMLIPYLLSLTLSVTIFAVFGVSPVSIWSLAQAVVCGGIFVLCSYTKRHKLIGGVLISIEILVALFFFSLVAFSGVEYLQWFISGADTIENTFSYLMSLMLIFTLLFSMVTFYYTQVYYRTSAIMLVTLIPYVVYVKLIREVAIGYVMVAIVLNVAAFLFNVRKQRDRDKRIVGYKKGLVSVFLYAVCFILIAFAIPKSEETKYYHFFEEWFLGGNTSVPVPEEYGVQSEHSGNADNFNQLTNRQLYNIYNADLSETLYLRRQVFDYYDFENHRWYGEKDYSKYTTPYEITNTDTINLTRTKFLELLRKTEEVSPGFLEKYNLQEICNSDFNEEVINATVFTRNFESFYLPAPVKTISISMGYDGSTVYTNTHRIYGRENVPFARNQSYDIEYVSDSKVKEDWISQGGSDMTYDTEKKMLDELYEIWIRKQGEWNEEDALVWDIDWEYMDIERYARACEKNTEKISEEVVELAVEITKDCTYEWEKAEAIERYFHEEQYVYDLEYDAPDDSVEYFLFEGKTGTCSDFASAYVLLARAAGLTVRYVEGFVPTREVTANYEWHYVVRTKTAHAYPEVYIPNLGFVVYEPTVGIVADSGQTRNYGVVSYVITIVMRVGTIFAGVIFLIALILLVSRIIAPAINETYFLKKVHKAENGTALIMLYKRIRDKETYAYIKDSMADTPYEFALQFEYVFQQDISALIYLVEKAAYRNVSITNQEKQVALEIYQQIKSIIKEYKRKKRHKKRGITYET